MAKKEDNQALWLLVGRYFWGDVADPSKPLTAAEIMDYAAKYNKEHEGEEGFAPYALRVEGDSIVDANQNPQDIDNYEIAIRKRGHNALSWLAMTYESRARCSFLHHAARAIKTRGYVKGLSKAEKYLVHNGALVYFFAPYRGRRRLFMIDWRKRGQFRYFARRPLEAEIKRLGMLGATIAPELWHGWALPGEGAEL
jgi:hypothetical protein